METKRKLKKKKKWKEAKKSPPDGPPPTGYERDRITQARQAGCWLLIRGTVDERQWVLFSTTTGDQLGWYSPKTGLYGYGKGRIAGAEPDGFEAIAKLVAKAKTTGKLLP